MAFDRIGVVGSGMMGSEIALVSALAGHKVLLGDQNKGRADAAIGKLETLLKKGIGRGFYSEAQSVAALANLHAAESLDEYADRDLVIEAIFASNTSSISITVLSSYVGEARRKRFLGTHFFSPVSRMKLVEVIAALDTDPAVAASVTATLR